MITPSYTFLESLPIEARFLSQAFFMHPNPRYFKYYWRIFHRGSPNDGAVFLKDKRNRISTAQAFQLKKELQGLNEPYVIYNSVHPRLPSPGGSKWDTEADKWRGLEWAPAWENDGDPEYDGHK